MDKVTAQRPIVWTPCSMMVHTMLLQHCCILWSLMIHTDRHAIQCSNKLKTGLVMHLYYSVLIVVTFVSIELMVHCMFSQLYNLCHHDKVLLVFCTSNHIKNDFSFILRLQKSDQRLQHPARNIMIITFAKMETI